MRNVIILDVVAAEQQPTNFDDNQKKYFMANCQKEKKLKLIFSRY
jgi:hypothetical protein